MNDVNDLFDGFEYQDWNDDTKALLMARFIQEQNLSGHFDSFLQAIANEENAGCLEEDWDEEDEEDNEDEDTE